MQIERIEEWIGREVVDVDGEKVGKLAEIHFRGPDAVVGELRSGLFSKKTHLVPLAEASAGRDYLRVPHAKTTIENAPGLPDDGVVGSTELLAVSEAFGCDVGSTELESSQTRAARREADEAATRRADELEAEAARLAAEAEDAVAAAREADRRADDAIAARDAADRAAREARAAAPVPPHAESP